MTSPNTSKDKALIVLTAICCAAPFLYICYLVNRYAVNVPFWDDWAHVPMIRHFLDGHMQWSELWAQHNEHRLLIFRIARLFFVWASHWNLIYEMYFSLALTVVICGALVWLVKITHRSFELKAYAWLLVFIALLNWSPSQWENFLWGHGASFFLQNTFAVLSLTLLTIGSPSARNVFLPALCATLSTYSSGAGLFIWPVGLIVLLITSKETSRSTCLKWRPTLIWAAFSVLVLAFYLWTYSRPDYHPALLLSLRGLFNLVLYVSAYVGSVFVTPYIDDDFFFKEALMASLIGGLGIVTWITAMGIWGYKAKNDRDYFWRGLPWFAIGNYALMTAFMIGISRVGFSKGQSLSSRYVTNSILFWIALAALINLLSIGMINVRNLKLDSAKFRSRLKVGVVLVLSLLLIRAGFQSLANWRSQFEIRETVKTALINGDYENPMVSKVVPDFLKIPQTIEFLRKEHLSLFRSY